MATVTSVPGTLDITPDPLQKQSKVQIRRNNKKGRIEIVTSTDSGSNYKTLLPEVTSKVQAGSIPVVQESGDVEWSVLAAKASTLTGVVSYVNGGTGQSSYAAGDIIYANQQGVLSKLPVGSTDQLLTVSNTLPVWQDATDTLINKTIESAILTGNTTLSSTSTFTPAAGATLDLSAANVILPTSTLSGFGYKAPVRAATTASIALSGTQTIDSVALVAGDRVLVKNQSSAFGNGIYIVSASAWARSVDLNVWSEASAAVVVVQEGTANQDTVWLSTANASGTIGSTNMPWGMIGVDQTGFGLTTQVLVGGGDNVKPAWTEATGAGAPVRAGSPTFTGAPLSTTAAVDTNSTQIATTAYVINQAYAKLASPTITTPVIAQINSLYATAVLKLAPVASSVNYITIEQNIAGQAPHIYAQGTDTNLGLHLQAKGTGYVNIQDTFDTTKRIRFGAGFSATNAVTTLEAVNPGANSTIEIRLPGADTTLAGLSIPQTFTGATNTFSNIAVNGTITINGNSVITAAQPGVSFPGNITLSGGAGSNNNGGSINTSSRGGNIDTSGNNVNGGGYIKTSGWNNGTSGNNGGYIDTSSNGNNAGGFINTTGNGSGVVLPTNSNGGGYIYTGGNTSKKGGDINTSASSSFNGGGINTSGGTGNAGGYIDTSNNGGYMNTTGNGSGYRGGFIITSGNNVSLILPTTTGGGYIFTAGNNGGNGGNINTSGSNFSSTARAGGDINTSAGSNGVGGYINTTNGGGLIDTRGNNSNIGGYINTSSYSTSSGIGNNGGFINTSGNSGGRGGNIDTSGGGGNINTGGINGNIELGISANRTVLKASGVACSNINLPSTNNSVIMCNKDTAINLALVSSFF